MLSTFVLSKPFEPAKSMSSSECLVLPTNGLILNLSKVTMLKLHVEEAKMSVSDMNLDTLCKTLLHRNDDCPRLSPLYRS